MTEPSGEPRALTDLPDGDVVHTDIDGAHDAHGDPDSPAAPVGGLEGGVSKWRIAESLETLRRHINALAPGRSKVSDGGIGDAAHASRKSDHNPWVTDGGVGVVTARDFTHDPTGGCDGEILAEGLRASRDPRIKYIIWNRRICAADPVGGAAAWAWRPYSGPNPHKHHVHLSVRPEKPRYDSTAPWPITLSKVAAPPAPTPAPAPPAGPGERDQAIADIEKAAQALAGLTPLLQRLTDLQDSADPTVAAKAGDLIARYVTLAKSDQPKTEAPSPPAPAPASAPNSYDALKAGYEDLFASCQVRPEWAGQVAWHRQKLLQYRPRYEEVSAKTKVPWWFVGIVHALEASFNFASHLHNGDPLTARTVNEPKDRPKVWNPPNDWVSSAVDALEHDGHANQADWTLARTLHRFEGYNGFGYRSRGIPSPYLWSFSTHYAKGKFVKDKVYDPEAVSKQCGAAVMLQALIKAGDVSL